MKKWMHFILPLLLTACASETASQPPEIILPLYNAALRDMGAAPELTNETWLNVDEPLRLADLRGRVVALEMWTFDCINCKNVIPALKEWDEKYRSQGLTIIGNHYPELDHEFSLSNLKEKVLQYGIEYAVTQDNDGATWNAYKNIYWPTLYLIDKQGHIRYIHIGEGRYEETEAAIQTLLAENYP